MRQGEDPPKASKRRDQWRDLCLFPNAILKTRAAHDCREKWMGEAARLMEQSLKWGDAYEREERAVNDCVEALPAQERMIDLYRKVDEPPISMDPGARLRPFMPSRFETGPGGCAYA
ncbi:MAG TPA: hypothetical protein VKH41_13100 [Myxococcota bacterium]|nr:hypothetical protein [Myxococcota bacterium]